MSQPLRIGLIGAGRVARKRLRAYREYPDQLHLAAVCDVDPQAAQRLAAEANTPALFTDARALIRDGAVDAIDICTPHCEHAPAALAALAAGKHVLCEKPFGCSMSDCREVVAAAEKAGVTLMAAMNHRFHPGYRAVRRVIEEGELGTIRAIRLEAMLNVPASATPDYWIFDPAQSGGGVIMSLGLQRLDLARYLLGEIRRLTATTRSAHPWFKNVGAGSPRPPSSVEAGHAPPSALEDYASALLEFETGVMADLFISFSPFRAPWGESLLIFGDEGTLHVRGDGAFLIASRRRSPAPTDWYASQFGGFVPLPPDQADLPGSDSFTNQLLHFAHCCRSGSRPLSSGQDNLRTMQAVFALYQSARTGRPVELA